MRCVQLNAPLPGVNEQLPGIWYTDGTRSSHMFGGLHPQAGKVRHEPRRHHITVACHSCHAAVIRSSRLATPLRHHLAAVIPCECPPLTSRPSAPPPPHLCTQLCPIVCSMHARQRSLVQRSPHVRQGHACIVSTTEWPQWNKPEAVSSPCGGRKGVALKREACHGT